MAKGRGRSGAPKKGGGSRVPKPSYTSRADIPMDDIESFDAARDKILLDDAQYEPDADEEDFGADDREVLSFGDGREESDEEEEEDDAEDDDDDGAEDEDRYNTMHIPASSRTAPSNARRAPRDDAHGSDSEEEVESDEDESGWGANKRAYYSGNTAEDLESDSEIDEDKAHELETAEAVRLQRLSRAGMDDSEFGLENIDAEEAQINADEQSAAARAKRKRDLDGAPTTAEASSLATPDELIAELQRRAPIVPALVDEFRSVLGQLKEASEYAAQVSAHGETQVAEIAHLYYQTLSCYAMVLSFFFQLASTPAIASNPDRLLQHPVMDRLSQLKKALVEMRALGLFDPEDTSHDDDRELAGIMGPPSEEDLAYEELSDLSEGELEDLLHDEKENQGKPAAEEMAPVAPSKRDASRRRKAKVEAHGDTPVPTPLAAVASVRAQGPSTRRTTRAELLDSADAYGEPVHLRATDAQEKAARRRATQFHSVGSQETAQAKAVRLEGDQDIPYRDRQRSRDAVAAAKSSKVAKKVTRSDPSLSNAEWGDEDWDDRHDVMDSAMPPKEGATDDDAMYYDLISSNKRARKAAKKEVYDEQRLASRVAEAAALAPGEHRLIDRTIEKNKGLTPHRPKSVRNPRVKRRMKFDKANKRLSSTRAVYKGGQDALQGGYQGEKSGISTHLVKSRKLGS